MRVFEVFRNDERLCTAGIQGDCVLTAIVDSVRGEGRDECTLTVGGLVDATEEHLVWTKFDLKVGDEIHVRVLESDAADEPKTRKRHDPDKDLEAKKNYVREMAKFLGWTVTEQSDSN